ncbi:MAG: type III pantothenate kinase [Anaplasma sp.]
MILAVDVGNTSVKVAVYANGKITHQWKVSTCNSRTAAEYFAFVSMLTSQESVDIKQVRGAAVSSVVPAVSVHIREMFENFLGISPMFVQNSHAELFGVKIRLAQEAIGTDRLAGLVAARALWPDKDLLVVDMGTVTVFNLLDKHGALYGQVMTPGISCLTQSMKCAALLPQVCVRESQKIICSSTAQSMETGLYWGYRSMVEGVLRRIFDEESDKTLHVVATGGGSRFFKNCKDINDINSLLTISGIIQIYERAHQASPGST